MNHTSIVDQVVALFERGGADAYFGELVSQEAHALQTAWLADRAGAPDALVVAALLHDVGHLVHGLPENVADVGIDGRHQDVGQRWLTRFFGPAVTEPVRLHVDAKRYLCAVEPAYHGALSPASRQSLELQGGPFDLSEAVRFVALPFADAALQLRRWDDEAKNPSLVVPPLARYLPRVAAEAQAASREPVRD